MPVGHWRVALNSSGELAPGHPAPSPRTTACSRHSSARWWPCATSSRPTTRHRRPHELHQCPSPLG